MLPVFSLKTYNLMFRVLHQNLLPTPLLTSIWRLLTNQWTVLASGLCGGVDHGLNSFNTWVYMCKEQGLVDHVQGHISIKKTPNQLLKNILCMMRLVQKDFCVQLLKILSPPCIPLMWLSITGNRLPVVGWGSENPMLLFVNAGFYFFFPRYFICGVEAGHFICFWFHFWTVSLLCTAASGLHRVLALT